VDDELAKDSCFASDLGANGNNNRSNVSKKPNILTHYRIGGHLPVKRYTVIMTQNRGIQTNRGKKTRMLGSGNEPTESRLALKPQTDRSRGSS